MDAMNVPERQGESDPVSLNPPVMPRTETTGQQKSVKKSSETFDKLAETGVIPLMKMYISPLPNVMPAQTRHMMYQTETVRSQLSDRGFEYTPWSWMERLRIYGIRYQVPEQPGPPVVPAVDININTVDMSHRVVQVGKILRQETVMPTYSNLYSTIKTFLGQAIAVDRMSQQRALQPVRGQRDLQALANLVTLLPPDALSYYDEAPMLRLALLMHVVIDANTCSSTSTVVQQTFVNCVPNGQPALAWSDLPADGTANCRQPNVAINTVNIQAYTLDMFLDYYTGRRRIGHAQWVNTAPQSWVVVPVLTSMRGNDWLMPYIAAFTTTSWWNFSRTVTYDNIRQMDQDNQEVNTAVRALVEACTVVIDGHYRNIVLVIVDSTRNDFGENENFQLRSAVAEVHAPINNPGGNYGNFATAFYTWLGRMGDAAGVWELETAEAWTRMCEVISMPGMADRITTMVSELSYTRRAMATLATGLNPGAGVRRHNGFLALGEHCIQVDGTNFLRWEQVRNTNALGLAQLRAEQTLRHTSCGLFPSAASYIGSGAGHADNIPCFNGQIYNNNQYVVNKSNAYARLAIASGLVIAECGTTRLVSAYDYAVYTQGTSSLMLGMAGWAYGSTGLAPVLSSGYITIPNTAPRWCNNIVTTMSDNFIVDRLRGGRVGIGAAPEGNIYNVDALVPLMQGLAGAGREGLDSITVPFWYVYAVMQKMNVDLEDKQKTVNHRFGGALAAMGKQLVYSCSENTPWWLQHLVMSDQNYEVRHWDYAGVMELDAAVARYEVGWYPDMLFDQARFDIASAYFGNGYTLPVPGVLQTVMTDGAYLVQYADIDSEENKYMKAYVWGRLATIADRKQSWPEVVGGLRYPDPFWDWLWEGASKVGPHVLMGNYGSAAAEAFKHLATPAVDWAGDKIAHWVQQRTG